MAEPRKILLGEDELPSAWFNIVPSMPTKPDPYLHPQTREPVGPDALAPLFAMALIGQEVSTDEWVDIPGPVLDTYKLWRPTPLIRALDLERALGTPARIYYKYEGGSPAGSHKPNTAVPQAFYNKAEGISRLSTETGAGQWGSALAFACARFDLERGQAVPALDHGDLGGQRHPLAVAGDQRRPGRARPGPGLARVAGHRHLRGGRGRRHPRGHPLLARARAQPRAAPPDGDRPGAQGPARAGRDRARRAGR